MELVREPRQWWDSRDNLADLYDWMSTIEPGCDFGYVLRKPWKFTPEYDQMRRDERDEEMERLAATDRDEERYAL